jgi:hypothetical protein
MNIREGNYAPICMCQMNGGDYNDEIESKYDLINTKWVEFR